MIVWINGAFGSGKTTTAGLVTKRLDGAKLFDPEYVGYMLTPFVASPIRWTRTHGGGGKTMSARHWPHSQG